MPSKTYMAEETKIYFSPAAATNNDVTFECDALATGNGYQSAQYNLTPSGSRARRFNIRAFVQCQATPTLNKTIDVYLKTSDGTHVDNDDGTTDGAVSSVNKLKNLHYIFSIIVDEAAANVPFVKSGDYEISAQKIQFVFWNDSGATLTTDDNENGVVLMPVPDEAQ